MGIPGKWILNLLKLKCFILLLSRILLINCGFVFFHGKYSAGLLCESEYKLKLHLGYFFLMGATGRQRTAVTDNFVGTSSLSSVSVARQSQAGIGIKRLQRLSCKETSFNRARQICNYNHHLLSSLALYQLRLNNNSIFIWSIINLDHSNPDLVS